MFYSVNLIAVVKEKIMSNVASTYEIDPAAIGFYCVALYVPRYRNFSFSNFPGSLISMIKTGYISVFFLQTY